MIFLSILIMGLFLLTRYQERKREWIPNQIRNGEVCYHCHQDIPIEKQEGIEMICASCQREETINQIIGEKSKKKIRDYFNNFLIKFQNENDITYTQSDVLFASWLRMMIKWFLICLFLLSFGFIFDYSFIRFLSLSILFFISLINYLKFLSLTRPKRPNR